ncbi:MAG: hypothetical protein J6Q73_03250 [Bacteroidaceae bacterium]|nr:hypothetical protein [Bacteroidaceae bacterium]
MKKFFLFLNYVGAIALLSGLVMRMFLPDLHATVYICGAVIFAVTQFLLRPRCGGVVIGRLVAQQQLAGLFLVGSGVLMFTHFNNEWIAVLLCGTLMELYTVFRISHEMGKLESKK